ncbi:MAG: hypothetical protein ACJA0M_002222, partial [Chitinophagales bacterium]
NTEHHSYCPPCTRYLEYLSDIQKYKKVCAIPIEQLKRIALPAQWAIWESLLSKL